MFTTALKFRDGHLYANIDGFDWLLDTGAPTTFGDVESLSMGATEFTIPDSYMGLNATQLSGYVGHSTAGIIGADVLNEFYLLIDVQGEHVSFSIDEVELPGDGLQMEEMMGVPIIHANIAGADRRMFFDTGAQISYFQDESLNTFPSEGAVSDFYPGMEPFQTETYRVEVTIGGMSQKLRCGSLPEVLGMTLMIAGTEGIIGNEILSNRIVGYFPKQKQLIFA